MSERARERGGVNARGLVDVDVDASARANAHERRDAPVWLAPAGAAISFVGALCGIGGGLFVVPLLHYVRRFPMRNAVATSVVHVLLTALFATAAELVQRGNALRLGLVAALGAGALVGAEAGYRVSKRIDPHWLKLGFALVAALAGAKMLYEDFAGSPLRAAGVDAPLSVSMLALALAIGAAGGMLTPLLGIGGGLVFVPALHLSMPELDYNAARACSLAVAIISASRSTWLYARERSLHVRSACWLGVGAACGAVAGVIAIHSPDERWLRASRITLCAILFYVALRFAHEAWTTRRAKLAR